MPNLNTQLLEFVNRAAGYYHPLDELFVVATSYYTLLVIGVAVAYYIALHVPMKQEGMARLRAFKDAAIVLLSVLLTWIAVTAIKVLVAYPRPFKTIPSLHVLISLPNDYSFPSGHAALTMALATAVYMYHKRLGALLFALAIIVGLARIYVGVHYPLDVGVGFLIGFIIPKILQHLFVQKESLKLQ